LTKTQFHLKLLPGSVDISGPQKLLENKRLIYIKRFHPPPQPPEWFFLKLEKLKQKLYRRAFFVFVFPKILKI